MNQGILMMKRRDRDRLKVIHELLEGHLTQKEAGCQLGLSERQVRRIQKRVRHEGDAGILHHSRGKPSNRRVPDRERKAIEKKLRAEKWHDFGPTYAQEQLAKAGHQVGRETVRKVQLELGLRKARRRREIHRERRERRSCFGELVQMDTSNHDWLEGRGEKMILVAMIDDANSRMRGRFFKSDSTFSNLSMIRNWTEEFGRPIALYVDKASHFRVNNPRWTIEEELSDRDPQTQIQRAMGELGIQVIWANSPQAKGRVERLFGTLQDRLVKGMRLAGVKTLKGANRYLEETFIPEWEERWTVRAKKKVNAHRRLDRSLDQDSIFSVREWRTVGNDYTVRWNRRTFQITKQVHPPNLRGGKVEVETRLDGSLALRFKSEYLKFVEIESAGRGRRRRPAPEIGEASNLLPEAAPSPLGL